MRTALVLTGTTLASGLIAVWILQQSILQVLCTMDLLVRFAAMTLGYVPAYCR